MDFIIGLPPSRQGDKVYNIIYIIVNRYTKMALYLPTVKTISVTELVDLFLNKIVLKAYYKDNIEVHIYTGINYR